MDTEKKSSWSKKTYSKENSIAYRQKLKKKNLKQTKETKNLSETELAQQKKNKTYSHRAGDWVCILCNNHNYSFRDICNRCKKQTKTENLQQQLYLYQNENFNPNLFQQLSNFGYSSFYNGNNQNFNNQNFNNQNIINQNFTNQNMNQNFTNQNFSNQNYGNHQESNYGKNNSYGNFVVENFKSESEFLKNDNDFNNVFEDKSDFSEGYDKDERVPFKEISINNKKMSSEDKFMKLQNKVFFELEEKFEEYSTNDDEDSFNEKENKILQFLNI